MSDPNNIQADVRYRTAEAERGKFFEVDEDYLTSLGYPLTGQGKYAMLTYSINGATSGGGGGSTDVYQNAIFSDKITLTGPVEIKLTSVTGNGYIKMRVEAGTEAWIGGTGVTSGDGYYLNDAYPVESLTFDDLGLVHVVGEGVIYIIGGTTV